MIARISLALTVTTLGLLSTGAMLRARSVAFAGSSTVPPTILTVNTESTIRRLPASFFGINDVAFWGQGGGETAARALSHTSIRAVRFPGGAPADWYDWQDPNYKDMSQTSPLQAWEWARSFGAQKIMFGTNYQGNIPNPPGKSYSVNSPENAAAWVAYNRSTGIVNQMEVGNEEDIVMHSANDPAFSPYINAFNAQAKAMHQADHHVRVLGPAGTNEYYWWGLNSLGMFLAGAGNKTGSGQADGVSLHWYTGNSWADSQNAAQAWVRPNGPWSTIQKVIHAHDTRSLPVYITEWNVGTSQQNTFNATVGHALVVSDVLGAFALSGVAGEDYFGLRGASSWGLLYGKGESRPADSPTPTYYAMSLWQHMGNRVVPVETGSPQSDLSTYATTGKSGSVQVMVINKKSTARTISLKLQGASTAGRRLSVYSLSGTDGGVQDVTARYDGVRMPSPQHALPGPRVYGTVRSRSVTYHVPGNSAIILSLSASPSASRYHRPVVVTRARIKATSPRISVQCRIAHTAVADGKRQSFTIIARSRAAIKGAHIDLEVYDPLNNRVFHASAAVDFTANKPVTMTKDYIVGSRAGIGTYRVKAGIFDVGWKQRLAWNDNAGNFGVSGRPTASIFMQGDATPSLLTLGGTETITALVSTSYAGLSNTIVDTEVIGGNAQICHSFKRGVSIPAGHTYRFVATCHVSSGHPAGTYTVKIGLFGPNWHPLYSWTDRAATFTVR